MGHRLFLILSASGGVGHIRAAQALYEAAQSSDLPVRAIQYDCLDFTSDLFKRLYSDSYLAMVNRTPELWGYFYAQTERKPYRKRGLLRIFDHFNYQRYLSALRSINPDAILCTHFLPYISVSERLRRARVHAPVFAVTTDFDVHQLWIDPLVSRYYVHHEESAWQLHAKGVQEDRIVVKGIPVHPDFAVKRGIRLSRRGLGIAERRFTVLLLSGGFGVGRIEDLVGQIVSTLAAVERRAFNLLIVCGRNEKVKSRLEKRRFPRNIDVRTFGFVGNVHELMDAADVLVSKSGGLTSAEAMAKGLPMIIVDPIPGQETRNAGIVVEHGAGFLALDIPNVGYKLRWVIEHPTQLAQARSATRRLAKPHAAREIIRDVYSFVQHHH